MNEIKKKLNNIFLNRIGIDFQEHEEYKHEALLGAKINIPPRELVLICFDIEKDFKIKIPEGAILKGDIGTYEKIYNMINRMLNNDFSI